MTGGYARYHALEARGDRMAGTRRPYPAEFRAEALRLVRTSGRSVPQIARELGVSAQTLRNWSRESEPGLTTDERARLRQLEQENRLLRAEREVWRRASRYLLPEATDAWRRADRSPAPVAPRSAAR